MNEIKGKCTVCGTAIDDEWSFCVVCNEAVFFDPGYDYDEWEDDEDWDLIEDWDDDDEEEDFKYDLDEEVEFDIDPDLKHQVYQLDLTSLIALSEMTIQLISEKVRRLLIPSNKDMGDIPF